MISLNIENIRKELPPQVKLVAVSKFHPVESLLEAMEAGQRCFAESRPQEFAAKYEALHGARDKLKLVLPYADLVQSVDSLHLLQAIDSWARAASKTVSVLLELHIGAEQTKQGFVEEEVLDILFRASDYPGVRFCGLMGMATNTDDEDAVRADFARISHFMEYLKDLFPELDSFRERSIGMSDDWRIALGYGATMVRIGTAIVGPRQY